MYYEFAITIPANTAETSPVYQDMRLTEGIITHIEVQFPNGCAGLAHCRLLHWAAQKWPTLPANNFASDGHAIMLDENFELSTEPYELRVLCWNDDDTFDHTIYVRVGVLRGPGAVFINRLFQGLAKMLALMGIK